MKRYLNFASKTPILTLTFIGTILMIAYVFPALIPLLTGLIDLGENAQIVAMLITYPDVSEALVRSASFFTQTKNILALISQITTGIFVVIFCIRWLITRLRS